MLGVQPRRRTQFLHRRGRLLQGAGLALGTLREVLVTLGNLGARRRNGFTAGAHHAHEFRKLAPHAMQFGQQMTKLVLAVDHDDLAQIAVRDTTHGRARGLKGPDHGCTQPECHSHSDQRDGADDYEARAHGLACREAGLVRRGLRTARQHLLELQQQLGRFPVHARNGLVTCPEVEPGFPESLHSLAVVLAHQLVLAQELLDKLSRIAASERLQQLLPRFFDPGFLLLEVAPIRFQLLRVRPSQEDILPLLHLHLEVDEHG